MMDGFEANIESHKESLKHLVDRDQALYVLRRNYGELETEKQAVEDKLMEQSNKVTEL